MIRDAHGQFVPSTPPLKGWEAAAFPAVVTVLAVVMLAMMPFVLTVRK